MAALAATAAWAWQRDGASGWLAAVLVAALAGHCLWQAWRRPVLALRWDGERWWLGDASGRSETPGDVAVALDLGAWLLLRFRAAVPARRPSRPTWLPVQRAGLQAHWHALRCALYSPRPQASPPAAPDPSA